MSVVQGGPGFPFFLPAIYKYITTGDYLSTYVDDSDIPDEGVKQLVTEVSTKILKDMIYIHSYSSELQQTKKISLIVLVTK